MCGNFNNKTAVDNSSRQSSVLVDADHPWLGLLSFREQHRRFFFGREREIADLHERARRNRLTVLFGPSGLGKTSILQAGLCPLLRESGALPVLIRLTYPGREMDAVQPPPLITQIAEKIATTLTDTGHELPPLLADPTAITSLWALFHDTVGGLCHAAAPRIVLLIDQFEEIFTLGEDEARAKADAASLRDALADFTENRPPPAIQRQIDIEPELAERFDFDADPCRIVIVLREDYLARLERWRSAMPGLLRNRMEIRLLDGPRAFDAVAGPARLEGRDLVTAAVAADIVRAVAGAAPGTPLDEIAAVPPLLSLLCAKLNELRLKHAAPQISADLLKISIRDILEDFYKGCFAQLPSAAAVRNTIETLLISPSGFRESPSADSVLSALRARGVAHPAAALRHLEDERLITSEERGGIRRVEITHDVLAPLAHASRTAAQLRARRRKLVLWTVTPVVILAAVCLPLTFWALNERKSAIIERDNARKSSEQAAANGRRAEMERSKALEAKKLADEAEEKMVARALELASALDDSQAAKDQIQDALAKEVYLRYALLWYLDLNDPKKQDETSKFLRELISEDLSKKAKDTGMDWVADDTAIRNENERVRKEKNFTWTPELNAQYPAILSLTLKTASMDDEERKYWFDIMPAMTPIQRGRLLGILLIERVKLDALERKFGRETNLPGDAIRKELSLHLIHRLEREYKFGASSATLLDLATGLLDFPDTGDRDARLKGVAKILDETQWGESEQEAVRELRIYYLIEKTEIAAAVQVMRTHSGIPIRPTAFRELAGVLYAQAEQKDDRIAASNARRAYEKLIEWDDHAPALTTAKRNELVAGDLINRAAMAAKEGESHIAEKDFKRAIAIREILQKQNPESIPSKLALTRAKQAFASFLSDSGKHEEAIRIAQESLGLSLETKDTRGICGSYLSLSWYYILAKRPKDAISAASDGLRYNREYFPLYTNLAHGYLFTENQQQAEEVYFAHIDDAVSSNQTWAEVIAADFAIFRKAGLSHPGMTDIEAGLRERARKK